MDENKQKWIARAVKKGALRKQLGAKDDERLSYSELEKASRENGKKGKLAKQALLLRRFQHRPKSPMPE